MEPEHDYKNIHTHDHHDDDSSTEVESLVGMDKQWTSEDFERRTRRSKRSICLTILKASRWFLVIGLQLIIVALLAHDEGLLDRWIASSLTSEQEVGGDVTGWGPHSKSSLHALHALLW